MTNQETQDEIRPRLLKETFFTMSTCGEACWEAREDVCHCSCHGKNHGILKTGTRPKRTCKMGGFFYELCEIMSEYGPAKEKCRELRVEDSKINPQNYPNPYGADRGPLVYFDSSTGDPYHMRAATKSQLKWEEVGRAINCTDPEATHGCVYFIWKRIPNPIA